MPNMIARRQRCAGIVLVVVLLGVASIAISAIRRSILRAAGWALVVNERVEPADVIVVAVGAGAAGVLEARRPCSQRCGHTSRSFAEPRDTIVEREFIRGGVCE